MSVLLLCLGVTAYFVLHAINGKYGLGARTSLVSKASLLEQELVRLEVVRTGLRADVARLQADNLDLDYLDERARAILNLAHPDDLIIRR